MNKIKIHKSACVLPNILAFASQPIDLFKVDMTAGSSYIELPTFQALRPRANTQHPLPTNQTLR